MIDERQREIYARQIMLPEMGEAGQEKLFDAAVLVVGVGGLGSPVALYLAAMGIGRIGLIDGDVVSLSNLNRQILYARADLGRAKVEAAGNRLSELNPELSLDLYNQFLTAENAAEIIGRYDMAVDCLDNFAARFILNDACLEQGKPFVHAGVHHLYGQTLTVLPGKSPCLRCLFPGGDPGPLPPKMKGILGATAGVIGAAQAIEVYKYLLGESVNSGGLFIFDGGEMSARNVALLADENCRCRQK